MKMKNMWVSGAVTFAAVLLAVAMTEVSAQAQSDVPLSPAVQGHDAFYMRMGGGPMGPEEAIGFIGFEADLGGRTVTGAPFTATISTQTTQVLADGNHIDRTTSGTMARDSQGRTRRDMTLTAIGAWSASGQAAPHVVFINDGVAGVRYILQPDKKIARKIPKMNWGKHGDASAPGVPADTAYEAGTRVDASNVTTASLGAQTINGVQAEGTRSTRTIPAGTIGNANAIVITNERWYSPELQTVVMTKRSDPLTGNTTFQLTNIQKEEPDASLFQVPSDYTIKQGRPGGAFRFKQGRGGQFPPPPPEPGAQP